MAFLVATTSLPAVYQPNDDRWIAARSCQYKNAGDINSYPYLLEKQPEEIEDVCQFLCQHLPIHSQLLSLKTIIVRLH